MGRFHREPSHHALYLYITDIDGLAGATGRKSHPRRPTICYTRTYSSIGVHFKYFISACIGKARVSHYGSTFRFHVSTTPHRPRSNAEKKLFCGEKAELKYRKKDILLYNHFVRANFRVIFHLVLTIFHFGK